MSLDLEQFCKAIDIIVSERLSNMSFDSTMICTIMDASDKDRGHYIVSDGTIRFDAYTNDTSYNENDQVRVSVLNGNFNERKFIEGPYIGDTSGAPVSYISPLSTTLSLESNAIEKMGSPQNLNSHQIRTNTDDEILLWEVDISNDVKYQTLQANGIYNTITLSADFMTNLGNLTQGNYGLVLDFFIKQSQDSNNYTHRYVTFDSSEMIGNPYSFELYSHQEKKINIAAFGMISMIRLSAYEGVKFSDSGNEEEINGRLGKNRIDNPFLDATGHIVSSQPINIRNIKLGFGNDLIAVTNNTLQLYTTSPVYYNYYDHTDATNSKKLGLLWLNKTDTNEYIGYSDGIFDLNYDEIQYRKDAHGNNRLEAQMNKVGIADDEQSLTLAANIAEAESYMIKTYELLTTDLSQVLQALKRQIPGAPEILNRLVPLIESYDSGNTDSNGNKIYNTALLNQYSYNASQATTKLVKFYSQILNYGYNKQNNITPNDWNADALAIMREYTDTTSLYVAESDSIERKNDLSGVVNWNYSNYYIDFVTNINNALSAAEDFFTNESTGMITQTALGKILSGYAGICDTYYRRASAVIAIVRDNLDRINHIFNNDVSTLQGYQTKTNYQSYNSTANKENLAQHDNKYCVYWYHYSPGFTLEYDDSENADNTEYLFGNFAGPNWKRITHIPKVFSNQTEFNTYKNSGKKIYTVSLNEKKDPVFTQSNTWSENTKYYIECVNIGLPQSSYTKDNKTYCVAQPQEAESVISLYLNPSTQDEKIKVIMFKNHEMITSNVVEFENADDVPEDKEVDASDTLRIEHDANSQDHYQVYSSAYDLVNISDGSKMRQLKCYYEGILSGDETLVDSWLYWYVPTSATLLTYDKDYLVNTLGFSTDADQRTEFSLDNYVYFAKKVEKDEEAPEELDPETGIPITKLKDVTRTFAYKIKSFYEPAATNNTILVKARISGYQETINGDKYFSFSTFGNNGTKYTLAVVPTTNRVGYCTAVKTDDVDIEGGINLKVSLKDAEDNPLQMYTINSADKTGNLLDVTFLAPSGRTIPQENCTNIEGSNDWNIYIHEPNLWNKGEDAKSFLGIIKTNVSLYNDATNRNVTLQTLYPISYAADPNYYISGPTVIVYNNQGTVSRISEAPYQIFKHTINGDVEVTPDNPDTDEIIWTLEYYDNRGTKIVNAQNNSALDNIYAYMPKLNADNTLTPAPMYFTYEEENGANGATSQEYYPVVRCEVVKKANHANKVALLWTQPIVITQNKYASSTLNNWDGTFTIDEANGTLMATMLGAGKKTAQNTFEGVLIGDIAAGDGFDPDNASGIGIYGFNDGDQSFHFGTDGTAFIGKSGRGRIYFNGNSGTISSASYEQNKSASATSAGMLIDLDDGYIDIKGTTVEGSNEEGHEKYKADGYSSHIVLNAKADNYNPYFKISTPNIDKNNAWNDKNLIYIGLDDYYLQSENYSPMGTGGFQSDGALNNPGRGMRISLRQNGVNEPYIDAFNLKVMSQNIFLDSTSNAQNYFIVKSGDGNNLLNIGANAYYLKTNDFNSDSKKGALAGLKIDLQNGNITAYNSFKLLAGSTASGGVMLNANPTSGENYLYAGKDSVGYIKVANNGAMSLYATAFKLEVTGTNPIYLSNEEKSWTVTKLTKQSDGSFKEETDTTNIVFGLGSNFAVDKSGNLYAKNVQLTNITASGAITGSTVSGSTVSGSKISGGTIVAAHIYGPSADNKTFELTTAGKLICSSAEIGGWNVENNSGGFSNGNTYVSSSGIGYNNKKFYVDKDGNLFATSATFDSSLDVKATRGGNNVFSVDSSGNLLISGSIYSGSKTSSNKLIFQNHCIFAYGTDIALYSNNVWLGTDKSTSDNIYVNGNLHINTNVTYGGVIKCKEGTTEHTGVNGTVTYVSGGFLGGAKKHAKFVKGILVDADVDLEEADTQSIFAPVTRGTQYQIWTSTGSSTSPDWKSIGYSLNTDNANNGKFLKAGNAGSYSWEKLYVPTATGTDGQVWMSTGSGGNWENLPKLTIKEGTTTKIEYDGTAAKTLTLGKLAFKDNIKKKVDISMTGTYTVNMSGYYTTNSGSEYYTLNTEYYRLGTEYYIYAYPQEGGGYSRPWRTSGSIPSGAQHFYTLYGASSSTAWSVNGPYTRYTRTAASNITLNLTGSKSFNNQVFEPSDTDDTIEFNATGVAFSKVTS